MKNYALAIRNGLLAFWHAFRGEPLANARERHREAVRAVHRSRAEVRYHLDLATYFEYEARHMDPHSDWHLFASLKDSWREHLIEQEAETKKLEVVKARADAALNRVNSLLQVGE